MQRVVFLFILITQINAEAQSSALQLGDSLYALGKYTKAINTYKSYENKDEVYSKIAKAYMAIGNYGKALGFYEKSAEANPENQLIKFEYAKLLISQKKLKKASSLLEELIYKDYKNPNYHYQKGLVLEKLKDSTAMNRFLSAYELDKTHQKSIFKIAKFYLKKGNHKASHRYIDKGFESYPDSPGLTSLKAQNYFHQDYIDKSIVWFNKLLELGEDSEFIHQKLSVCYAEKYEFKKAIFHLDKVLKYSPKDTKSLFLMGMHYQELEDFKNAEKYIAKALKIQDVSLNRQYIELGKVLNRQKKYKEALAAFQKALKENPKDHLTKFLILRTKDEYYKDRESVVKLYEDFIEKNKDNPFVRYAEIRLSELKEENFMNKD